MTALSTTFMLFVHSLPVRETFLDSCKKLVTHLPVSVEALLAVTFNGGSVVCRPIFHRDAGAAGQLQRAMVCFRRKCNDDIEVEALPVVEFLKSDGFVPRNIDADFSHCGHGKRIEFSFAHADRAHVGRIAEQLREQACRHWRADGIEPAG